MMIQEQIQAIKTCNRKEMQRRLETMSQQDKLALLIALVAERKKVK